MEYLFMGIVVLVGVGLGYFLANRAAAVQQQRLSDERDDLREEFTRIKTELGEAREAESRAMSAKTEAERQLSVTEERLNNLTQNLKAAQTRLEEQKQAHLDDLADLRKQHNEALASLHQDYNQRLQKLEDKLETTRKQFAAEREALEEQRTEAVKALEGANKRIEALQELKKSEGEMMEEVKKIFKLSANEVQQESVKKLSEEAKEKFGGVLEKFQDKLEDFKKQYTEGAEKHQNSFVRMSEQLRQIRELNQQMSQEAKNLTKALRGESKVQGNWGETLLKKLLEIAGFQEGKHYHHDKAAPNSSVRPDIVVELPDNRCVIIDSKVSLTAYTNYVEREEPVERDQQLRAHIQSIETHIKGLSSKNYAELFDGRSPDFVIMFVPVEPAFMLALQHKHELTSFAFEKKIILVSPTSLLAMLRLLNELWQRDDIRRNALEIAEQGGKIVDKLILIQESFHKSEDRMRGALDELVKTRKRMYTGHGNLNNLAHSLTELGVRYKKELPPSMRNPELPGADSENGHDVIDQG
ncbi:MAG: DNA recombination protein RmuC [Bacteroidota bacterium]